MTRQAAARLVIEVFRVCGKDSPMKSDELLIAPGVARWMTAAGLMDIFITIAKDVTDECYNTRLQNFRIGRDQARQNKWITYRRKGWDHGWHLTQEGLAHLTTKE